MTSEDKYDTLEKIGHGSFGVIRKVRRKADGFIMCRKEISYLRMSQKEREQLHAEFQILSHLRHPNIVAYYHREHLKVSQDLHLYMEYCGNGDLGRVIKDLQLKGQRAQESFVWSIFSQLVLALYRCHYGVDPPEVGANVLGLAQGVSARPNAPAGAMTILHRDLKPENVFLGEDNSVKLGDFGLSKMIKSHDFASTYVGTPFYMSPEICAAEKYTLKSDIWSLGCIIYELCSREPPFNAKTHFQLVQKIKEGKVAPLPDMYSPELNQVIKDCLKVNPDKRPDTTQLLNLPVVKLMRKEKEVVDLNRTLRTREEAVKKREREISERLAGLDREREAMRLEMDSSLRREWEVKARLEINRLVSVEVEQLQKRFEDEVQARVDATLTSSGSRRTVTFAPPELEAEPEPEEPLEPPPGEYSSSLARSEHAQSSVGGTSGDEFPSTTDITEYSIDSPEPMPSPHEARRHAGGVRTPFGGPSGTPMDIEREARRPGPGGARTPFGRAQTMFAGNAGTPMDVEMASPSPIAIASLALSPRRNGATKAPSTHTSNIFAAANKNKNNNNNNSAGALGDDLRWDVPREPTLVDSDDEDVAPSPTRQIRSSKNPFTSKTRPVLMSQKSCPANRLRTQASIAAGVGAASKTMGPSATPQSDATGPRSPNRRLSKIPAAAMGQGDAIASPALSRKPSLTKKDAGGASGGGEALGKVAAKNNIKGRTLVELQQARAGGRPLSAAMGPPPPNGSGSENLNLSPKRGAAFRDRIAGERRDSTGEPAVWDPERDEMPSPFLARQKRMARV